MTIKDVIEELNKGKSLESIANELGMKVDKLEMKLQSSAVEFDENEQRWEYKGVIASRSLSRDITSTIRRLKEDKQYIKQEIKRSIQSLESNDLEIRLYKDYLNMHQVMLDEKKTFFLTEEIYDTIKKASLEKSLKINPLINLLLKRGLQYYSIEI